MRALWWVVAIRKAFVLRFVPSGGGTLCRATTTHPTFNVITRVWI
jgi:hypothetical protein